MSWLGWQIDYLLFLQNCRDLSCHVFDKFFLSITLFGEVLIPIAIICLVLWCINKKAGTFILLNYFFGFLTNTVLKTTACIYRPWILDSRVKPLADAIPAATGYSFPSGHTAGVVSIFGSLAISFWNNKILRTICFIIILLVMISRNYLGVHTPQDVIVSFVVGVLLLWGSTKLMKWVDSNENADFILVLAITLLSILIGLYVNLKSYPIDYVSGKVLYDPTGMKAEITARMGFVLGVFYGWLIEKRFIDFKPEIGSIFHKIIRYVVGIAFTIGLVVVYIPYLKTAFGHTLGTFIGYVITSLFITLFYPMICKLIADKF